METTLKKLCSKCKINKNILNFKSAKTTHDKLSPVCIQCKRQYDSEYRTKNRLLIKEKKRLYQIENKEEIAKRKKVYHENNKHIAKAYREDNKEKIKENSKLYRNENKERIAITRAEYYKNNRDREIRMATKRVVEWQKTKEGKLTLFIRSSIGRAINYTKENKNINSTKSLDYSIKQLKDNIESKFTKGMTWENYGVYGWHIDHIIPISHLIKIHKDKSQRDINNIVNALDNLQPLWAKDNLKKGSKLLF